MSVAPAMNQDFLTVLLAGSITVDTMKMLEYAASMVRDRLLHTHIITELVSILLQYTCMHVLYML